MTAPVSEAVDEFEYKTYRCEWQVQCGTVDQYGQSFNPYKTYSFPTRQQAVEFLPTVATESEYVKGRWLPKDAPHSYCEAQINYRQVEIGKATT